MRNVLFFESSAVFERKIEEPIVDFILVLNHVVLL